MGSDKLLLKQVFKEIYLFEERRSSKESVNLSLGVGTNFNQSQPSSSTNQSTTSTQEKKKFVKEECENGVHNPKATHKE
jgi:biotin-(acetyl-CoA carboxylase) ligase